MNTESPLDLTIPLLDKVLFELLTAVFHGDCFVYVNYCCVKIQG